MFKLVIVVLQILALPFVVAFFWTAITSKKSPSKYPVTNAAIDFEDHMEEIEKFMKKEKL